MTLFFNRFEKGVKILKRVIFNLYPISLTNNIWIFERPSIFFFVYRSYEACKYAKRPKNIGSFSVTWNLKKHLSHVGGYIKMNDRKSHGTHFGLCSIINYLSLAAICISEMGKSKSLFRWRFEEDYFWDGTLIALCLFSLLLEECF